MECLCLSTPSLYSTGTTFCLSVGGVTSKPNEGSPRGDPWLVAALLVADAPASAQHAGAVTLWSAPDCRGMHACLDLGSKTRESS